jgi:hypothetical protein
MAVTLDTRPRGLELLAVRVGVTLERWGRESAERRARGVDPRAAAAAFVARDVERASHDVRLTRIR